MPAQHSVDPLPFSVDGKTAIITGAGSGINLAFARLLVSRGCNVVLADLALRPEASAFASQHNGAAGGPRAAFVRTDVTSWPALEHMFEFALSEFGRVDVVCPGAGVYEPEWSSFWHPPGSPESRDGAAAGRYALVDINVVHPLRTTQLAIAHWMHPRASVGSRFPAPEPVSPRNPKRIIHISSIAGQVPVFRAPMYGASKFAITGLVRCLAPIEAAGIVVTAVAPGVVKTPLWTEHEQSLVNVDQEKDTWVTPEEVAETMLQCVEKEPGGTILEVASKATRRIKVVNDPGPAPDAKGIFTSNSDKGEDLVWGWLRDPKYWSVKASL